MGGPVWYFIWLSPLSFDWLRMSGCWLVLARGRIFASLSAYGRGARNYFTYFSVYSARHFVPARGLGQSRGHQWGEAVSELGL